MLRIPLFLVLNGIAARLLEPAEFGIFLLTISIAEALSGLTQLGLPPIVTYRLASSIGTSGEAGARTHVRTALRICTVTSLAAAALLVSVGPPFARLVYGGTGLDTVVPLASVVVAGRTFERLLSETYRGFHDIRGATIFGGLWTHATGTALFAAAMLARAELTTSGAVLLYGAASLSGGVVAYLLLRDRLRTGPGDRFAGGRGLLRDSWPVLGHQLLFTVIAQADLWIVAALLSAQDTALYGAALRVVVFIALPLNIANQIVPPLIARMHRLGDLTGLQRLLRAVATVAGLPALLALGAIIVAGGPLLGLAFGDFYRSSAPILAVLGAGQVINVCAGTCSVALIQTGQQHLLLAATAVAGAAMTAAATIAAVIDGTVGVAVAAAGGVVLQNVLMVAAVRRRVGVWTPVGVRDTIAVMQAYRHQVRASRSGS